MRIVAAGVIDAFGGLLEVGGLGVVDAGDELLRVQVDEREPGALHLDHDAMTGAESVIHVRHLIGDPGNFVGLEGFGLVITIAEAAAKNFAANQLLVISQMHVLGIAFVVGVIAGIDVDEFDDEIRIGAGGGDEEFWLDGPTMVTSPVSGAVW